MRSRWFHAPRLHTAGLGIEKKATWLELFYDLIFVAVFIQLGNGLSSDVSLGGFLRFVGVFAPLWMVWSGFAFYVNRFTIDDFVHRLLVFAQMFAVGGMGVASTGVASGNAGPYCACAAAAHAIIALMHYRSYRQLAEAKTYNRLWGTVFGVAAAAWLIASFVPAPETYLLWIFAP